MDTTVDKSPRSVLLVEDEAPLRRALERFLRRAGYAVRSAGTLAEGRNAFDQAAVDVALVDFRLPDGSGADLIRWAISQQRAQSVYGMTSYTNGPAVRAARAAGCLGILEKPFDISVLIKLIEGAEQAPEGEDEKGEDFAAWRVRNACQILGEDSRLMDALHTIWEVADTECTVLVTGESGTGKELFARALHDASPRAGGPFVALNCAAIPESMVEAELFGHARGAFTGAHANREGRVAGASGGTLFLDEIGDMPLAAQAKLLRMLQDRTIMPVGSDRPVDIDVRVVAATNQDLESMVEAGRFRGDLFYRLNVIPVELPPLRERGDDIARLAEAFLHQANRRNGRNVTGFESAAMRAMREHYWPGNVRELSHLIERTVLLKKSGLIAEADLRLRVAARGTGGHQVLPTVEGLDLRSAIEDVERRLIEEALDRTGGNRTEAAALLGVNRTTLVEKIRKHSTKDE
ncbi:sigma-54-dependent transcriptional regulator [Haliangium ochraceum]|uniref:Two component, sigma54 specific, transcriptional regulator, Fis family n=1 Tax=Haliangium ochraceum (strain DSM 14365 / JCM 11303 / SMP-2) TaxID=502025 RepID=D0LYF6_HALO1|nr:sigma-54 dependent transcriptional regulator [Haliangium ochraceum]ACY17822.1 two component, sigma54 specific, transcriptional regulator, Fis family [Haliangium ochraceum DSM 14365]